MRSINSLHLPCICYTTLLFLFFRQVSRGAECVMISKKFFINQASELTKKWIRHNVSINSFTQTMEPTRLLKRQKCNFTCYGNPFVM